MKELQQETNTKISVAPLGSHLNEISKSVNEIIVSGMKDDVDVAASKILAVYEDLQKNSRTLVLPISKKQHRFIIGPKGANLNDIFEKTGCVVDMPAQNDPSDIVTILGSEKTIGTALNLILEKVFKFHYLS